MAIKFGTGRGHGKNDKDDTKVATLEAYAKGLEKPSYLGEGEKMSYPNYVKLFLASEGGPFAAGSYDALKGYFNRLDDKKYAELVPSWVEGSVPKASPFPVGFAELTAAMTVKHEGNVLFSCCGKNVRLANDTQCWGWKVAIPPGAEDDEAAMEALYETAHDFSLRVLCRSARYKKDADAIGYLETADELPPKQIGTESVGLYKGDNGVFERTLRDGTKKYFTLVQRPRGHRISYRIHRGAAPRPRRG